MKDAQAELVVKDIATSSMARREEIADWLYNQADQLLDDSADLDDEQYQARFMYAAKHAKAVNAK